MDYDFPNRNHSPSSDPNWAIQTAATTAQSRSSSTRRPVHAGGLRALVAANSIRPVTDSLMGLGGQDPCNKGTKSIFIDWKRLNDAAALDTALSSSRLGDLGQ